MLKDVRFVRNFGADVGQVLDDASKERRQDKNGVVHTERELQRLDSLVSMPPKNKKDGGGDVI